MDEDEAQAWQKYSLLFSKDILIYLD